MNPRDCINGFALSRASFGAALPGRFFPELAGGFGFRPFSPLNHDENSVN